MTSTNITPFIDPEIIELYRKQKSSFQYFSDLLTTMEKNKSRDLFSGCSTILYPLSASTKENILSYINKPTHKKWEDIYAGQITPASTLWQAWTHIDAEAPRRKQRDGSWACIPDGATLTLAIRKMIEARALESSEEVLQIKAQYQLLEKKYPTLKTSQYAQTSYFKYLYEEHRQTITAEVLHFNKFRKK